MKKSLSLNLATLGFLFAVLTSCDKPAEKIDVVTRPETPAPVKSRDFAFHTSDDSSGVVTFNGDWSALRPYVENNLVAYLGSMYICKVPHPPSATVPSADTAHWVSSGLAASNAVSLTGAQTVTGEKTFNSIIIPLNPDIANNPVFAAAAGSFTVAGNGSIRINNGSNFLINDNIAIRAGDIYQRKENPYAWTGTSNIFAVTDTALFRDAGSIVAITDGTPTGPGALHLYNGSAPTTPSASARLYANSGVLSTIGTDGIASQILNAGSTQTVNGAKTFIDVVKVKGNAAAYEIYDENNSRFGYLSRGSDGQNVILQSQGGTTFLSYGGNVTAAANGFIVLNQDGSAHTNVTCKSIILDGNISIASGANQRAGVATLVGGTVTIANTTVTANTHFQLTMEGAPSGTAGVVYATKINGTSFTITGLVTDNSNYSYLMYEVIP